jgi:hypothetical protein
MGGQETEHGELPVENRAAAYPKSALVDAAQPACLPASKNRCRPVDA